MDAIKYGVRLLGYLIAVILAGGILMVIGGELAPGMRGGGSFILAAIFYIAGFVVFSAGYLGIFYKLIADGVERGVSAAK